MADLRSDLYTGRGNLSADQLARIDAADMGTLRRSYTSGRLTNDINPMLADIASLEAEGTPDAQARAAGLRNQVSALEQRRAAYAPEVGKVENIAGIGSGLTWAGEQVGQGVASMQDTMLTAAGLTAAGKLVGAVPHPIAKAAGLALQGGGVLAPYLMNQRQLAGEAYGGMTEDPELMARTTPQQRYEMARNYGALAAIPDTALPALVGRQLAGAGLRKGLSTLGPAATTGLGMLGEGTTELGQEMGKQYALGRLNPERDTSEDFSAGLNSFLGGAVGAGPFAAAGAYADAGYRRVGDTAEKIGTKAGQVVDLAGQKLGPMAEEVAKKGRGWIGTGREKVDATLDSFKGEDGRVDLSKVVAAGKETAGDVRDSAARAVFGITPQERSILEGGTAESIPADIAMDPDPQKAVAWVAQNDRDRVGLVADRLSSIDDPQAADIVNRIADAQDPGAQRLAVDEGAKYLLDRAEEIKLTNRAGRIAQILGSFGAAAGKGVLEFGKAVVHGAKEGLSKKNAQIEPWEQRKADMRAARRSAPAERLAQLWSEALAAAAPQSTIGEKGVALFRSLGERIADLTEVSPPLNQINRIARDIRVGFGKNAEQILDNLASMGDKKSAPTIEAIRAAVVAGRTPAGQRQIAQERQAVSGQLLALLPIEQAKAIIANGQQMDLLEHIEDFADGHAAPALRPALEAAVGKENLTKMVDLVNGVTTSKDRGNEALLEARDDDVTDYELRQAEKKSAKGSGPKIYGVSKSPVLRDNPFAPNERMSKEEFQKWMDDEVQRKNEGLPPQIEPEFKRPMLFKTGDPQLDARVAHMSEKLDSTYHIAPRSAWEVMDDTDTPLARRLAVYRDYMREDGQDTRTIQKALMDAIDGHDFGEWANPAGGASAEQQRGSGIKTTTPAAQAKPKARLSAGQRNALFNEMQAYFSDRHLAVAEQIADREPSQISRTELLSMVRAGKRAFDLHRMKDSPDEHLDQSNLLMFKSEMANQKTGAPGVIYIPVHQLVKWVQAQHERSETKVEERGDEKDKTYSNRNKNEAYLADVMEGISIILNSGMVENQLPARVEGLREDGTAKYTRFAGQNIPKNLRLATMTYGQMMFGREKAAERRAEEGKTEFSPHHNEYGSAKNEAAELRDPNSAFVSEQSPDNEGVDPYQLWGDLKQVKQVAEQTAGTDVDLGRRLRVAVAESNNKRAKQYVTTDPDATPLDSFSDIEKPDIPDEFDDQQFRTKNGGESAYSPLPAENKMNAWKEADKNADALLNKFRTGDVAGGLAEIEQRLRAAKTPSYSPDKYAAVGGLHYAIPLAQVLNPDVISTMDIVDADAQRIVAARAELAGLVRDAKGFSDAQRLRLTRAMAPAESAARITLANYRKALEKAISAAPKVETAQAAPEVAAQPPKSSSAPGGGVDLRATGPYAAKDQAKADRASKFIGRGSPASSTAKYARAFGRRANSGQYAASDTVFVSAEGRRSGRLDPDFAELKKATDAGATILTDDAANRKRLYNLGERQVAEFLIGQGYSETAPGTWTRPTATQKTSALGGGRDATLPSRVEGMASWAAGVPAEALELAQDVSIHAPAKAAAAWRRGETKQQFMAGASGVSILAQTLALRLQGHEEAANNLWAKFTGIVDQTYALPNDRDLEDALNSRLVASPKGAPLSSFLQEYAVSDLPAGPKAIARAVSKIAGAETVRLGNIKADGEFNTVNGGITVSRTKKLGTAATILHEGVHAATAAAVVANPELSRALYRLLAHVTSHNPQLAQAYGTTNTLEFLAEGLSNMSFQRELYKIPANETVAKYLGQTVANAWEAFVAIVRKALNIPALHDSALTQLISLGGQAMKETAALGTTSTRDAFDAYSMRGMVPLKQFERLVAETAAHPKLSPTGAAHFAGFLMRDLRIDDGKVMHAEVLSTTIAKKLLDYTAAAPGGLGAEFIDQILVPAVKAATTRFPPAMLPSKTGPDWSGKGRKLNAMAVGAAVATMRELGFTFAPKQLADVSAKLLADPHVAPNEFMRQSAEALSHLIMAGESGKAIRAALSSDVWLSERAKIAAELMRRGRMRGDALVESYRVLTERALRRELQARNEAEKSFIGVIVKAVKDFMDRFRKMTESERFAAVVREQLNAVIARGQSPIDLKKNYRKVTFQEAIDADPQSARVLAHMSKLADASLTGSIVLATTGSIYRDAANMLHDLDFVVRSKERAQAHLMQAFPSAQQVYDFTTSNGKVDTFIVPPPGAEVTDIIRKGQKVIGFTIRRDGREIGRTWNDEHGEHKSGETGTFVDLFSGTGETPVTTVPFTTSGEQYYVRTVSPGSIFDAKLSIGRDKDLTDYLHYVPMAGRKLNAMAADIHRDLERPGFAATHDSPIRHEGKFDWRAHQGKGEGNAAFGAGTYLSTANGVHKSYKRQFSGGNARSEYLQRALEEVNESLRADRLELTAKEKREYVEENLREYLDGSDGWLDQDIHDALQELKRMSDEVLMRDKSPTYQVSVDIKPEQLLDWDAPLSEQSELVKQIIRTDVRLTEAMENSFADDGWNISGGDLYKNLTAGLSTMKERVRDGVGSQAKASDYLQSLGILGHKYAAVGGKNDTHPNYVIYDDSKITTNYVYFNAQDRTGSTRVASDADMAAAREYVRKVLGPKIEVLFENLVGYSGEWLDTENVIKISTTAAAGTMQTAYHEALHAFFSQYVKNDPKVLTIMKSLAEDQRIVERVHALLHGYPAAQAQLADGEERLAYIYQFWAAGQLKLGVGKGRTWLQKLGKFFRGVLGMVRDSERALELFQAFHEGKMAEPSAAGQVIAKLTAPSWTTQARRKMDGLVQIVAAATLPSQAILLESASKAARELGHALFSNPGEEAAGGHGEGYINARVRENRKYHNQFANAVKDLDGDDLDKVAQYLQQSTDPANIPYRPHAEAVVKIRNLLDRFYTYMKDEKGMDVGYIERYYPVIWSTDILHDKKAEFIKMLTDNYGDTLAKGAASTKGNLDEAGVAERIWAALIRNGGGDNKIAPARSDGVLAPFFEGGEHRVLNWIKPEHREPFLQKDLIGQMSRYFHEGARKAEYQSRFGERGERLATLLDPHKAVFNEVQWADMNKNGPPPGLLDVEFDVKPGMKTRVIATFAGTIQKELMVEADKMVERKELKTYDDAQKWVARQMRDVRQAVGAMEGTLGKEIPDGWRKFNSWMITYQNIRLLPLALFSSIVDPLGMVARGAELKDAYAAFVAGMKEVVRVWGNEFRDEPKASSLDPKWTRLAEFVGATEAELFAHHVSEEYSSGYMHRGAKNLNDKMFVLNGMEAWNRSMRIAATKAAVEFILKHKNLPDKIHSARWLQELGLKPADIAVNADGELVVDRHELAQLKDIPLEQATVEMRQIHWAINRWVEGAILTPNAAQRPSWSSDPRWGVFFHLKQFTYSFHYTLLKRAVKELEYGNIAPIGAFAWYIPVMLASDITRGLIQGGGELPAYMKGWDIGDHLLNAMQRAGFLGVGQIGVDASADPAMLGGPAVEQIIDAMRDPLEHSTIKALPLQPIYRNAALN